MLLKTGGGTVENGKNKKIKVVIIVLSVLLCVSFVALASIFIYNYFFSYKSTSVVISVNIITKETGPAGSAASSESNVKNTAQCLASGDNASSDGTVQVNSQSNNSVPTDTAELLTLYNTKADDNIPFKVENMFPGDSETKYYCVRVSQKDTLTVRFNAFVQPGYEKLADDTLRLQERRSLTVYFHYPESAENRTQNLTLSFDLCADAVQTKNNPNKLFN